MGHAKTALPVRAEDPGSTGAQPHGQKGHRKMFPDPFRFTMPYTPPLWPARAKATALLGEEITFCLG